jgi:hypothetical protein
MRNWLAGSVELYSHFIQNVQNSVSPVKDRPRLFVAFNVMLGFSLQLPIDPFILQDFSQTSVDFFVQDLVLLKEFKVVTLKGVPFKNQTIMLYLSLTHHTL